MKRPSRAAESCALAEGVVGIVPGLAWLPVARTLVAADAHLAYEEVVGGALPLWSTAEIVATLALAVERCGARELVFLGDIVHGPVLSEGAARRVREALDTLRRACTVTLVAGNHEGASRALAVLGATVEGVERDGWLLVHGDGRATLGRRSVIGHLHPSLRLGGRATAPAFVASEALVVLPALNPYSPGLDVLSPAFASALGAWDVRRGDAHVVAALAGRVYPFGSLATLRDALVAAPDRSTRNRFRRPRLGPDRPGN